MLRKDILGCNDEESVFLINIPKKCIVAQILLGLKVFWSCLTSDKSLIFCSRIINEKNNEEVELVQFKLNKDKDNMVRLRNKPKDIPGIERIFCLENNSMIYYVSQKNNIFIMKGNDNDKNANQ